MTNQMTFKNIFSKYEERLFKEKKGKKKKGRRGEVGERREGESN